jgi:hypothetical protein
MCGHIHARPKESRCGQRLGALLGLAFLALISIIVIGKLAEAESLRAERLHLSQIRFGVNSFPAEGPPRPAVPRKAAAQVDENNGQAVDANAIDSASDVTLQPSPDASAVDSEISRSDELTIVASPPVPANSSAAQELSVEPGAQPLLPEDAPAWIGALPETSGEIHRVHVGGQIADSPEEAAQLLDDAMVHELTRYLNQSVLQPRGAAVGLHRRLTPDYIWKNLIDEPDGYVARLNTTGTPLYQKWITLSITPAQRDIIQGWNREALQQQRLAPVGLGVLGLLGSVGVLHLIFKGRPRKK